METIGENEAARLAFVVPIVERPDRDPDQRSQRLRLRPSHDLSRRSRRRSPSLRRTRPSGASRRTRATMPNGSTSANPATRRDVEGKSTPSASSRRTRLRAITVRPFTDNPSLCTGADCREPRSDHATRTRIRLDATADYPETTGCENQRFDPVFNLELTIAEADAPSGLGHPAARRDQFLAGEAPLAVDPPLGDVDAPRGADDQPGRRRRSDVMHRMQQAGFGTSAPGALSGQLEDRDGRSDHAGARRPARGLPLHRRAAAGQPVPGLHDLRRLRDPRQAVAPTSDPTPSTGPGDGDRRRHPAGSRSKSSTCISSPLTAA